MFIILFFFIHRKQSYYLFLYFILYIVLLNNVFKIRNSIRNRLGYSVYRVVHFKINNKPAFINKGKQK